MVGAGGGHEILYLIEQLRVQEDSPSDDSHSQRVRHDVDFVRTRGKPALPGDRSRPRNLRLREIARPSD